MIVHQFLPTFERGAVGAHALLARAVLRTAGHDSEIYAAEVHPSVAGEGARLLRQYRGGADTLVYQMAIGSVTADAVLARREPLVVNHHNMTPARYFAGWEPVAAQGVAWGLGQLRELAARAALGVAVSHFNEADLIDAGFARTTVVPYLLDLRSLDVTADPSIARTDATTWLFVGRLAPNKAQHDLVKAFAAYRRFHDPTARLALVGGGVDSAYGRTLDRFVHALGLDDAISMPGAVSPPQPRGRTTGRPTRSWSPVSTRGSVCRWSRRCITACRSWHTRRRRCRRRCPARACCSKKRTRARWRRRCTALSVTVHCVPGSSRPAPGGRATST